MAVILIADDIEDTRELLRDHFERHGHQVITCPNGRAAIRHIEQDVPDLLITDIVMPECDGLELAQYIREKLEPASRRTIPIIAFSGGASSIPAKIALSAAARHVDVVLKKPVSANELLWEAAQLLSNNQR